MPRLTEIAHECLRAVIAPGDLVVDATIGNGYDTLFLARQVGATGHVFGFDIQAEALANTRQRLDDHDIDHVTLFERSHAELLNAVPDECHGGIAAIMFNLGYRPGSDKLITTQQESTTKAVNESLALLRPAGCLSVLAYRGHDGAVEESLAVLALVDALDPRRFQTREYKSQSDDETAPQLLIIQKLVDGQT